MNERAAIREAVSKQQADARNNGNCNVLFNEETHLCMLRRMIEEAYQESPTGCGGSFGEILCWEIHSNGMTFEWLADKWGVSLPT